MNSFKGKQLLFIFVYTQSWTERLTVARLFYELLRDLYKAQNMALRNEY